MSTYSRSSYSYSCYESPELRRSHWPTCQDFRATWPKETLVSDEEAKIAAAAAEAVALARAAVEVAKDAAQMSGNESTDSSINFEKSEDFLSQDDIFQLERVRLTEQELIHLMNNPTKLETDYWQGLSTPIKSSECLSGSVHYELDLQQVQASANITVRSRRHTERRARRARAAEKVANSDICLKSGPSSKKKRSAVQEIDYSDPLHYLRGATNSSKLLTASEELELSEGVRDLIKLESLREELAERNGSPPTFAHWAAAARVDARALRERLNYGRHCKDKMIKCNVRLVISIAKTFQGAGMSLQDLVQEGYRGLVKGVEKFDASKGFRFSTYAHWWIKQAVRESLSEQSRTIRLPSNMVKASYRVREARKQLYSENGRHPGVEEIAEAADLTMKQLAAVMLIPKAPRSLDQKIGIDQTLKLSEVIADPDALTTEEMLMKQIMKQDLNKVLDSLNPREKQIVRWRSGLEDGRMKTLQESGDLLGISKERARQIESCAFRKLKNKKRTKNLQQYLY